ncbi:MAG: DNA cytosine methyltransferase [bacterium]
MEGINVLSLFDGMSCGRIALERAGIKVNNYFASEIDKHAIKVTQSNYPNTIQIGDVTKVKVKTLYLSEVYSYICNYDNNLQSKIPEWEMLYWLDKEFTMSAKIGTQKPNEGQEVQEFTTLQCVEEIRFSNSSLGSVNKSKDDRGSRKKGDADDFRKSIKLQRSCWRYDYEFYTRNLQENSRKSKGSTKDEYSEKKNIKNIEEKISRQRREGFSFKENQRSDVETRSKKEILGRSEEYRLQRTVKEEKRNGREEETTPIEKTIRELQTWNETNGIENNYWCFLRLHKEEQITLVEYDGGLHVFKGRVDLCIGGSPCQGFSFSGKQLNFNDPRSKLFFEFVRLKNECNPIYFLLENVKMKKEHEQVITEHLGVEPLLINSALLTAHNRPRLYWTNIPNIEQPNDLNIFLKNIRDLQIGNYEYLPEEKTVNREYKKNYLQYDINGKGHGSQDQRAYYLDNKHGCLDTGASGKAKVLETDGRVRKITRNEAERLQGVPDNYTDCVSKAQAFKMLGNGWTVDVIAHIFKNIIA